MDNTVNLKFICTNNLSKVSETQFYMNLQEALSYYQLSRALLDYFKLKFD